MSKALTFIDWNEMSRLGLIQKINTEILHPLGLAISRNPENGNSEQIIISDDGFFEYSDELKKQALPDKEIKKLVMQLHNTK